MKLRHHLRSDLGTVRDPASRPAQTPIPLPARALVANRVETPSENRINRAVLTFDKVRHKDHPGHPLRQAWLAWVGPGWAMAFLAGLLGFCGGGCAGYRLGPTNGLPAGDRSVQIQPFENKTMEPRLPTAVSQALRRTLQQDGSMRLATREEGDVVVRGTFVAYDRLGLTYEPSDVVTIRDFDLVVTAKVTAIERSTGRVLFEKDFSGRSTVRAGTDLTSAERQALPLLAQDLARNIATALVEGTW